MGNTQHVTPHATAARGANPAGAGARWRKSSYSNHQSNCVEIAELDRESVGIRDSKDRRGPVLVFTREQARAFFEGVARGDFAVD